jgi:hypothetical protein|tara:strand:- start:5744 stop:6001 length:258 start_codon:yes stop_codon:yes gene_type:complete
MPQCQACNASSLDQARVLPVQLSRVSLQARGHQTSCANVRLLPDSLRDPVLALPPRDGRALLRLVGVFGGIVVTAASIQFEASGC